MMIYTDHKRTGYVDFLPFNAQSLAPFAAPSAYQPVVEARVQRPKE